MQGKAGERITRSTLGLLPAIFALLLLVSFQAANAAVPMTSGTTEQMGNALNQGNTGYVVLYSYPSVAQVGTNVTITLTLHVTAFTGQIEYIYGYALEAQIFIGSYEQDNTVFGPSGFNSSSFLYPGAYWGPINFTFPLTEANTGLSRGESDNATLAITLRDTVYYGVPVIGYQTEPAMQANGGNFLVQDQVASSTTSTSTSAQGSGQAVLPYALVASGAILIVAAALLPRGPRPAQSSQK